MSAFRTSQQIVQSRARLISPASITKPKLCLTHNPFAKRAVSQRSKNRKILSGSVLSFSTRELNTSALSRSRLLIGTSKMNERCSELGAKGLRVRHQSASDARRTLHTSSPRSHGIKRPAPGTGIKVHFKDAKGQLIKTVEGNEGDSLLDLAHEYDVDLEGACEGSVACSTCHVILTEEYFDKLEEPEDDENDMLDMAFGLTDTSRLGCQVFLTPELDGITATLPAATRNMFVDGAKPTKH